MGYKFIRYLLVAASGLLGLAGGSYLMSSPPLQLQTGVMLPAPLPVADFELMTHKSKAFTRRSLERRWTMVFTGFTACPDICPTTLPILKELQSRVRSGGDKLETVFVTVDPERDTPQVIADYLSNFKTRTIGVTGSKAEIDKLCNSLKLGYVKNPGVGGEYTMDHSTVLMLIDPQARAVAYFPTPVDPARLAIDVQTVMRSKP